jgi:hypothetical protein
MKWLVTAVLCVLTIPAYAQDSRKIFVVSQPCGPAAGMANTIINNHNEQPLFIAKGNQLSSTDSEWYSSSMMYFVNQDSGTWTLVSLYADGVSCIVASGTGFEPYID